jgi:hypothetical protein
VYCGQLEAEHFKLLQARSADAVPLDMLKREQSWIGLALKTINNHIAAHDNEYLEARQNLEDSLGLLVSVSDIYQRCEDLNRRLCNEEFFTGITIDEDGERRVGVKFQKPFDMLCDPEVRGNALNWVAEARKKGQVQTGPRMVPLVEGLHLAQARFCLILFLNLAPRLKSLVARRKRGVYGTSQRADVPRIRDNQGQVVRRVGTPQTFLTPSEVSRLVEDCQNGAGVARFCRGSMPRKQLRRFGSISRVCHSRPSHGRCESADDMSRKRFEPRTFVCISV